MKKRILLQCQSLTYLYMGLGAIYTKHQKDNVIIDVLLVVNKKNHSCLKANISECKYINNIFVQFSDDKKINDLNNDINNLVKSKEGEFLYKTFYKNKLRKYVENRIRGNDYSEIYFSHEINCNILSFIKIFRPNTHFIMYGDGSGLLMGRNMKTINPFKQPYNYYFFDEIKPDEVISLSPFVEDDTIDITGVEISATSPVILSKLIETDEKIQNKVNNYTDKILTKYSNYQHKSLLLISRLEDKRFMMSEEDQINIYIDMINKYCPENSLLILKLHPSSSVNIVDTIKSHCQKRIEIISIPQELNVLPSEVFSKLVKNMNTVISFLSSSKISLNLLYGTNCIDCYDIIQNYNLKYRINYFLEVYSKVLENYKTWDKKSLLFEGDIVPFLKEFYKINNITPPQTQHSETMTLLKFILRNIFSINKFRQKGKTRHKITILGINLTL